MEDSQTVLFWFHDHSLFGFNNISFSFCGIRFVGTFKKSAIFSRNGKNKKTDGYPFLFMVTGVKFLMRMAGYTVVILGVGSQVAG
jgi:hypothetical protein